MTKMRQKLVKIERKLRCFWYIFRIYSLKILEGGGLGGGAWPPVAPLPLTTPMRRALPPFGQCQTKL